VLGTDRMQNKLSDIGRNLLLLAFSSSQSDQAEDDETEDDETEDDEDGDDDGGDDDNDDDKDVDYCLMLTRYLGDLKRVQRTGWKQMKYNNTIQLEQCSESVADHSFRMAVLVSMISDDNNDNNKNIKINKWKATRMALIHDLSEAIVGDIAPWMGISEEDKHEREREAMKIIMGYGMKKRRKNVKNKDDMKNMKDSGDLKDGGGLKDSESAKDVKGMKDVKGTNKDRKKKEKKGNLEKQRHELEMIYEEYEARTTNEARLVKDLDRFDMIAQAYEYEIQDDERGGNLDLSEFFDAASKIEHPEVRSWADELMRRRKKKMMKKKMKKG
jgi:5'-deoxynucleotidase YfbR-like HD superfamily hydrolase